jgi:hypothetical protein
MTGWHGILDLYLSKNIFATFLWLITIVFSGIFLGGIDFGFRFGRPMGDRRHLRVA